ncbi:MAG: ribonuclease III [Caldimicrobium sp.]|nr:ribonuclease III [Caldimicrobium sp.]MCX7872992.1 ribonuclease III [Caldimicrobium sp.]
MERTLEEVETLLGITFKNKELLKIALTHSSYRITHREESVEDNERLEFIGDAVLNLCVSLYLYQKFPGDTEGELTKKRAFLVCKERLIKVADSLKLLDYIYMGRREKALELRSKKNIAGRTLEAIIGAIFLDQGLEVACQTVKRLLAPYLRSLKISKLTDYKTKLQELLQKVHGEIPTYEVLEITGPAHRPVIEVVVKLREEVLAKAKGSSKKEAENIAAKKALYKLKRQLT